MTNQVTENQLQELLKIQKKFDSRIPTLNLQDSKIAYVVECHQLQHAMFPLQLMQPIQ